mgnify:CR=1 FL=1
MQDNILEIKNLSKYFGGLAAVSNCSLKVKQGTITDKSICSLSLFIS